MSTQELLSSSSFLDMVITICVWAAIFIFVKWLSYRAGVGHLLKTAVKKSATLRKSVLQLRYVCTSKNASSNLAKAVRVFHRVLRREKAVSKVLTSYLFDDRGDMDVSDAKKMLDAIPDICRDVLVKLSESEDPNVTGRFDEMDLNLKQAVELIRKADRIDLKKRILKI
ncbi:MAG: hypothetical protein IJ863_02005 [Spirochaetales bacterium]|nr:hypothetical protein [Spirochaetales bacterium]